MIMAIGVNVAMEGKTTKPRPTLKLSKNGHGYQLQLTDVGSAGVKFCLVRDTAPFWDRLSAIVLSSADIDMLMDWLSTTTSRPAMMLPPQTRGILKAVITRNRKNSRKFLTEEELLGLKHALRALQKLDKRTTTGRQNSLASRARRR